MLKIEESSSLQDALIRSQRSASSCFAVHLDDVSGHWDNPSRRHCHDVSSQSRRIRAFMVKHIHGTGVGCSGRHDDHIRWIGVAGVERKGSRKDQRRVTLAQTDSLVVAGDTASLVRHTTNRQSGASHHRRKRSTGMAQ